MTPNDHGARGGNRNNQRQGNQQVRQQGHPPGAPIRVQGDGTRQPAVPQWARNAWSQAASSCAPGHLFTIYFAIWNSSWDVIKPKKSEALRDCVSFDSVADLCTAVQLRQRSACQASPECDRLILDARSIAPFATGLGIEHPVENGFAFLTPYGIPYLAGSGVKGVLRKAAEESPSYSRFVEMLFGTENQPEAEGGPATEVELTRGALTFWDVFPLPVARAGVNSKPQLSVEVMTPHHGNYLQRGGTPNDSEQPIPIPFLTVPADSRFTFIVTCDPKRITHDLGGRNWKQIVEELFKDAFAWLGFGAKTALGYGAMELMPEEDLGRQWVERTIQALRAPQVQDPLYIKALADEWKKIPDPVLKEKALRDIKRRWGSKWDERHAGSRKQAWEIYEGRA